MSGIVGIFHIPIAKPVDPARVRAMADAQAHRGPGGAGVWTAPGVGLGRRSSKGGTQLLSTDGAIVAIHDGAIQNAAALRAELTAYGHDFETAGDAEVIRHGWRQWGPACLDHFDGGFAFALFDARRQCLFLARDRLGVKPLHYAVLADGSLIFSSELKGLLANPILRREPDIRAIEDYLALGYVPDDACIIAGVRKLAAGHSLLVQRGKPVPEPTRWWDVDFTARATGFNGTLKDEMRDHLRRAVQSSMVADASVGALLSGGMNSAAIVALMAGVSNRAVKTCAIGFGEAGLDDADRVAGRFLTDHRKRIVDITDFTPIDALSDAFNEPFADASALISYRLCQFAGESMAVALSGDGADAGVASHRIRALIPQRLRALFGDRGDMRAGLYTPEFSAALNGHRAETRFERVLRDAPAENALTRARYAALKIGLPGHVLTQLDRTSMALGLEIRTPLLDHRLVQFTASLPLHRSGGKGLMKQALEPYLPADIRRPKTTFAPPVDSWFRDGLADEARRLAHGSMLAETGWFDRAAIARIADTHVSGARDQGRLLWQLLMLDKALRRLFG